MMDTGTTEPTANLDRVTPARLEKWRGAVSQAVTVIGHTRLALARREGERTGAKGAAAMNTPEDTALLDTQEALRHVWGDLNRALPPAQAQAAQGGFNDLFALDTPDTRALLDLLDRALAVAERVDRSRNRVLPDTIPISPSESRGTDLAEVIAEITARVRSEVHGSPGRGLE